MNSTDFRVLKKSYIFVQKKKSSEDVIFVSVFWHLLTS